MFKMKIIFKLFLPLIILNTLFGNSYNDALIIVSQIVGFILIAQCFFILHFLVRYKYSVILLNLLIISKVIFLLSGFSIFYNIIYSTLFIITGAFIFQKYLHIVRGQFLLYFVISGFVLFFQITGWFPILHTFNIYVTEYLSNYESIYGSAINLPDVFFVYGDRYSLFDQDQIYTSNIQFRPSGIFHSNAFLGPFMLVGYFFIISWYKKNGKFILFILNTFLLLITGSKLVLFCSFVCLLFNKKYLGNKYYKALLSYTLGILLYFVIFPIVFLTNYTYSAIVLSLGIRFIDQLSLFGNFNFLFSDNIIYIYSNLDNGYQGFSGFLTFVFIFLLLIILFFTFKKKYIQYFHLIDPESKFLYRCTFIWLGFVFFSTPLFGNHLVSFVIGLLFSPIILKSYGSKSLVPIVVGENKV